MTTATTSKAMEKRSESGALRVQNDRPRFVPSVDIEETDAAWIVTADMPGVDEKSVSATLDRDVLTLTGERETVRPEHFRPALREFVGGTFRRQFAVSGDVDRDRIAAAVHNGVLRVTLPKMAESRARKITVTSEK